MVVVAIEVSAAEQLLDNTPQGSQAGIVDSDVFVAAQALTHADEGDNDANIRPLDRALGLISCSSYPAQGCKLILLRLEGDRVVSAREIVRRPNVIPTART
jgi:hypothetical protein